LTTRAARAVLDYLARRSPRSRLGFTASDGARLLLTLSVLLTARRRIHQ